MRIKFLKTVTAKSVDAETFNEGQIYDLSLPSAHHWLRRRVAVEVDDTAPEAAAVEPPETTTQPKPVRRTRTVSGDD